MEDKFRRFHSHLTIVSKLGEGAYGKVYLVECRTKSCQRTMKEERACSTSPCRFAMKLVPASLLRHRPTLRGKLEAEARLSDLVRSAHVPRTYGLYDLQFSPRELGESDSDEKPQLYKALFMQYIDGLTLTKFRPVFFRVTAKEPETRDRLVLRLMQQAFSGLEDMHAAGLAHKDIKPDNIMLDSGYLLYIIDWGFVCRPDSAVLPCDSRAGSPYYMSREALEALGFEKDTLPAYATFANDVWAMGVTFFEFLTGRSPYELEGSFKDKEEAIDVLLEKLARNERRTDILLPQETPRSNRMIELALTHDPAERPTASQMYQQISDQLAQIPAHAA